MKGNVLQKGTGLLLSALCCVVYFTSYLTRINYGAAISEIVVSMNTSSKMASMAVTGSFLTYGIGQLVSGFLGDKIKPRIMIFIGLFITSLCNFSMAALSDIYVMTAVWCVNGFAQAMLWPPLVRIMSENLSGEGYKKVSACVVSAGSVATVVVYLLVPFCISLSGWRMTFIVSAIFGIIVAFLWLFTVNKLAVSITTGKNNNSAVLSSQKISSIVLSSGLLPIMVVIILMGILRDGITTWMPSYINSVYHLGTSISILSVAVLPVFSILSVALASFVQRIAKDEVKAATYIWCVGFLASVLLIVIFSSQAVGSIILMAVITGCMHGINLMLISRLPVYFARYGRVSTFSGLLNAFTYVGSGISAYGFASISDDYGWKFTVILWSMIALCGTVLSALCIKKWKRFKEMID